MEACDRRARKGQGVHQTEEQAGCSSGDNQPRCCPMSLIKSRIPRYQRTQFDKQLTSHQLYGTIFPEFPAESLTSDKRCAKSFSRRLFSKPGSEMQSAATIHNLAILIDAS